VCELGREKFQARPALNLRAGETFYDSESAADYSIARVEHKASF
jgi:hypothetical protein